MVLLKKNIYIYIYYIYAYIYIYIYIYIWIFVQLLDECSTAESRNLYISHAFHNCIFIVVCTMCNHGGKSGLGVQSKKKTLKIIWSSSGL